MAKLPGTTVDEIIAHFNELEDPRSPINRQHPLVSVVVIALMAVLAGGGGGAAGGPRAPPKQEEIFQGRARASAARPPKHCLTAFVLVAPPAGPVRILPP